MFAITVLFWLNRADQIGLAYRSFNQFAWESGGFAAALAHCFAGIPFVCMKATPPSAEYSYTN
jgi:hypothetical protein